jgi:hypothetical protein
MIEELKIKDEEILLLGLCRMKFGIELKVMLLSLAEGEVDWEYFAALANSHGVSALVYHNLDKLNFLHLVPLKQQDFLKNALLMSMSRNAFNYQSAGEVLKVLNRENIKTVFLKGMALELSVYENAGLRQMSDIDILTDKKECIKARDILLRNGFVSLPVKSVFHKLIITNIGKHLPSLIKNGASVEVHHELFGGRENILTRVLYDTSCENELNGERVYFPKPQIFFLYLVKHLYLHEISNESQLRLYTDLVVLLEKNYDEIINYDLLTYATQEGMQEILAWRLEPLRDLWGIQFPVWINEFVDKWYNPDSINNFIFFLKSPKDNPPLDKEGFYRNTVKEIPGIHRKVLYLLGDLFPSISFMKERYGCTSSVKVLFYYPHRVGKLWWLINRHKGVKA